MGTSRRTQTTDCYRHYVAHLSVTLPACTLVWPQKWHEGALQGTGEAVMKKSPGALARRPSNSHRRTISSSGAPACRRHCSTWRQQADHTTDSARLDLFATAWNTLDMALKDAWFSDGACLQPGPLEG